MTAQAWYENTDGAGLSWTPHMNIDFGEHHRYGLAVRTWVLDLDGDDDLDFVQSEADNPDGRVAWFENDGHGNWTRHMIKDKGEHQDFHAFAELKRIHVGFDQHPASAISGPGPPVTRPRVFTRTGGMWLFLSNRINTPAAMPASDCTNA